MIYPFGVLSMASTVKNGAFIKLKSVLKQNVKLKWSWKYNIQSIQIFFSKYSNKLTLLRPELLWSWCEKGHLLNFGMCENNQAIFRLSYRDLVKYVDIIFLLTCG